MPADREIGYLDPETGTVYNFFDVFMLTPEERERVIKVIYDKETGEWVE